MAINMSYCRHENTYLALREVQDGWDEFRDGSDEEKQARRDLAELITEMAPDMKEWLEDGQYDEDCADDEVECDCCGGPVEEGREDEGVCLCCARDHGTAKEC